MMKSRYIGILLFVVFLSNVSGQETASSKKADLSEAPLIEARSSNADLESSDASSQAQDLFALSVPKTADNCVVSTSQDALLVWGSSANKQTTLYLYSLETGALLVQTTLDREILNAGLNSNEVFLLGKTADSNNLIRLRRSDLSENGSFQVPKSFVVVNDHLLYSDGDDACYLLPEFKKLEVFTSERVQNFGVVDHESGLHQFSRGFVWRGVLWSHALEPKLLLKSKSLPKLSIQEQVSLIKSNLSASGEILHSNWPNIRTLFARPNLRPVVISKEGILAFCDPETLDVISSVPLGAGKVCDATNTWLFVVDQGQVNAIRVPQIAPPKVLEAKRVSPVLKHKSGTPFTYHSEGAVSYELELTDLPNGIRPMQFTSKTGEFEINIGIVLSDIVKKLPKQTNNPRYRHAVDEGRQAFEYWTGRLPKGVPYTVRINVAALHADYKVALLSHLCFLEIPVSKHSPQNMNDWVGTVRTWTDTDGKIYRDPFFQCDGQSLELRKNKDMPSTVIPISKLSEFDRVWLGIAEFEPAIE